MTPSRAAPAYGIYVQNFAKALADRIETQVLAVRRPGRSRLAVMIGYVRCIVHFVGTLRHKYEIVHVQFFYPLAILGVVYRLIYRQSRLVITLHGGDVVAHGNHALSRGCWGAILRRADYRIAVGTNLAKQAETKFSCRVNEVLSAGVNEHLFFPSAGPVKSIDLLFVGRLSAEKGVDILIDALAEIENGAVSCHFVGDGPLKHAVMELASGGRITWEPPCRQEDLRARYVAARYLVMPSRREAFGLTASEAMHCGTPVIAAAVGGLMEQVEDGRNGFLVPPNSADDLASTLKAALRVSGERYLGLAVAARHANRAFGLERVIDRHLELYVELVGTQKTTTSRRDVR